MLVPGQMPLDGSDLVTDREIVVASVDLIDGGLGDEETPVQR